MSERLNTRSACSETFGVEDNNLQWAAGRHADPATSPQILRRGQAGLGPRSLSDPLVMSLHDPSSLPLDASELLTLINVEKVAFSADGGRIERLLGEEIKTFSALQSQ